MIDFIPLYFAVPAIVVAWVGFIVVEVRAALKAYEAERASDPVVVTASGRPSNRYVRACKQEVVR